MASSRWPSSPSSLSDTAPEGPTSRSCDQVEETALVTPSERDSDAIPNFFRTRLWGAQSEGAAKLALPSDAAVAAARAITHGLSPALPGPRTSERAKARFSAVLPDMQSEADVNVGPQTPQRANLRQQQSSTTPASMEKTPAPQQPSVKKRPATLVPEQAITAKPRMNPAETPSKRPRSSALLAPSTESKPVAVAVSKTHNHKTAIVESAGTQDEQLVVATPTPLKKMRASPKRRFDLRGLALTQVAAQAFEGDQNGFIGGKWPRRLRMKPLDEWRNERILYERKPGSPTPSIKAVVLNCAPRPQNAGGRSLPVKMLSLATPLDDTPSEIIGTSTQFSHNKVITLPPWNRNKTKNPFVQVLNASELEGARRSTAVLKVLEGTLRMIVERPDTEEYEEADLALHSTVVLPSCEKIKILVTATSECGARAWWNVNSEPRVRHLALPSGIAQSEA